MTPLAIVCEGESEAGFVKSVLAPELAQRGIAASGWPMHGALNFDRTARFLRRALTQRRQYVATFFDLFRLSPTFPGFAEARAIRDPVARAASLEVSLHGAIIAAASCRPERFLPHIQPHEFEALAFSDVGALVSLEPEWQASRVRLAAVRASAQTPEHINDGPNTHPWKQLEPLRPRYRKTFHGPQAARRIGLARIRRECRHFGSWLDRVEALPPLDPAT